MNEKPNVHIGMTRCFFCGEHKDIIIQKRLTPKPMKAFREADDHVVDYEPCQKCKKMMEIGVILMIYDDEKTNSEEVPYRTGKILCVKDEAIKRLVNDEKMVEQALKKRAMFFPEKIAKMTGLLDMKPTMTMEDL